jgi:hypothetical protein
MFLHETIEFCSECQEVTPHSSRSIAIPKLAATVALGGAGLSVWLGDEWYALAVLLAVGSSFVLFRDRDKMWRVRCERCRTKKVAKLRLTKPTLDGTTVFDPL